MNSDFKDLLRSLHECDVHYLGKSDLIISKQTAGRLQDLADLDELRRAGEDSL